MNQNGASKTTTIEVSLVEMINRLQTREDFVAFVSALSHDRQQKVGEWENRDLHTYLEAVAAWTEDLDGYFHNQQQPVPPHPTWQLLAQILLAAKSYE
jgi:hypothetical protein